MKVELEQQLKTQSFRVKGVDVHPSKPLLVTSLFSGHVQLWNYESGQLVRSVAVSQQPVRAVRFVPRKNWIVTGGDDRQIRVYNASTFERVSVFEAHKDYIRYLVVHPTHPYVLSTGDDNVIHMWDWDREFRCVQTFRGHVSYVLGMAINPKDPNQFASGSMDGDVKVWNLDNSTPNYTLEVNREATVNFVEFYPFADKPYLITAGDDRAARVIDYQSKQVVATLTGHSHNVSFAIWHPQLPLIITGSEDNTIKLWNARSYKLEQTLNYGMQRAWSVCARPNSNLVAFGMETGGLVLRMGRDEPVVSMDKNGKLCWAKQLEAFSASVKLPKLEPTGDELDAAAGAEEGSQEVHLQPKDLGAVEIQPTLLRHSIDGKYVAVVGDGDVIVYTSLAWRNRHFTAGEDCAWGPDNLFAVLDASGNINMMQDFKHRYSISGQGVRRLFGYGDLLVAASDDFVVFYDWFKGSKVARIDVELRAVEWSDESEFVALVTEDDGTYVLKVDMDAIEDGVEEGNTDLEGCFEEAWSYKREQITSLKWIGDCLFFTTSSNRVNYLVGSEIFNITHFDKDVYLLRYVVRDSALYLCDKELHIYAQPISLALINFLTAVLRGDIEEASNDLLPKVPATSKNLAARFLESRGLPELALQATSDEDHKFDLALAVGDVNLAASITRPEELAKWRRLGDIHLASWNLDKATEAYTQANELDTLLLIHTSTGNEEALRELAAKAIEAGKYNLAFNAYWSVGDTKEIADLLNKSSRHTEAALFSWTYGVPIDDSVQQWKDSLAQQGRGKIASIIDTPTTLDDVKETVSDGISHAAENVQAAVETVSDKVSSLATEVEEKVEAAQAEKEEKAEEKAEEEAEAKQEAVNEATELEE